MTSMYSKFASIKGRMWGDIIDQYFAFYFFGMIFKNEGNKNVNVSKVNLHIL